MKNDILIPGIMKFIRSTNRVPQEDMHEYADKHDVPSVETETGELLRLLTASLKPERVLEIGSGIGTSTRYIKEGYPAAKVTGLDHNANRVAVAKSLCIDLEDTEFLSEPAADYLGRTNETFDMVFVDSVKRRYSQMWQLIKNRINEGGMVIFDDVLLFGMLAMETAEVPAKYRQGRDELLNFIEEVKQDKPASSTLLPVGSGVLLINF
jgi:predicted O-methyltransferase YrrM